MTDLERATLYCNLTMAIGELIRVRDSLMQMQKYTKKDKEGYLKKMKVMASFLTSAPYKFNELTTGGKGE